MLKFVVAAAIFLGTGSSCFSNEVPKKVELPFGIVASPALVYAGCGNMHLLLKDFELALEDYRKASLYLEYCDISMVTEFIISFGQIIAYDNLHLRDKCEQALGALILTANNYADIDEDEDDDEELSPEMEKLFNESEKMLHNLAMLAPSDDVREILLSIIDDLDE